MNQRDPEKLVSLNMKNFACSYEWLELTYIRVSFEFFAKLYENAKDTHIGIFVFTI